MKAKVLVLVVAFFTLLVVGMILYAYLLTNEQSVSFLVSV